MLFSADLANFTHGPERRLKIGAFAREIYIHPRDSYGLHATLNRGKSVSAPLRVVMGMIKWSFPLVVDLHSHKQQLQCCLSIFLSTDSQDSNSLINISSTWSWSSVL